jgi:hypothetical protein
LKEILRSLVVTSQEAANKQEAAMSVIIKALVVLACAYAGLTVAGAQFSQLPEASQMASE